MLIRLGLGPKSYFMLIKVINKLECTRSDCDSEEKAHGLSTSIIIELCSKIVIKQNTANNQTKISCFCDIICLKKMLKIFTHKKVVHNQNG